MTNGCKIIMLALLGAALAFPASARCTASVRALTYNIRLDTPADGGNAWVHRRNALVGQVALLQPDIVGLQEVLPNQKRDLSGALPQYTFVGGGRDDGRDKGEAAPLAFDRRKFAASESGMFWLSPTPDAPSKGWDAAFPRVVSWARLRLRGSTLRILALNTHWDHVGVEARRQSALYLRRWIAGHRRAAEEVVVLGDFNTDLSAPPMQSLLGSGTGPEALRDSRSASLAPPLGPLGTFNGFDPLPKAAPSIDHILVSPGLAVDRYAVLAAHTEGRVASDHFPVIADLSPQRAPGAAKCEE